MSGDKQDETGDTVDSGQWSKKANLVKPFHNFPSSRMRHIYGVESLARNQNWMNKFFVFECFIYSMNLFQYKVSFQREDLSYPVASASWTNCSISKSTTSRISSSFVTSVAYISSSPSGDMVTLMLFPCSFRYYLLV